MSERVLLEGEAGGSRYRYVQLAEGERTWKVWEHRRGYWRRALEPDFSRDREIALLDIVSILSDLAIGVAVATDYGCARPGCGLPRSVHGHDETGREDSHPFEAPG